VVDAEQMQEGGVQVMNVHRFSVTIVAVVIGRAVDDAALHAAAAHPDGEAARMMVAVHSPWR